MTPTLPKSDVHSPLTEVFCSHWTNSQHELQTVLLAVRLAPLDTTQKTPGGGPASGQYGAEVILVGRWLIQCPTGN